MFNQGQEDKSDRKSLMLLEERLKNQIKHRKPQADSSINAAKRPWTSRKTETTVIEDSPKKTKSKKNKKLLTQGENQNSKIINWLSKDMIKKEKISQNVPSLKKSKPNKEKITKKENTTEFLNIDEILANKKRLADYQKEVYECDTKVNEFLSKKTPINPISPKKQTNKKILDCHKVTNVELEDAFEKHKETLKGIIDGVIPSARHHQFHNFLYKDSMSRSSLNYNSVTGVFTYDQKNFIAKMLEKEFDPNNSLMKYFFQVLLPEFCLIIFSDVHKMTKEDASAYLDQRPLH